jgi:hypothetical protein
VICSIQFSNELASKDLLFMIMKRSLSLGFCSIQFSKGDWLERSVLCDSQKELVLRDLLEDLKNLF